MRVAGAWFLATGLFAAVIPATAQTFDGPPTSSTRYWEVEGFADYPYKGPGRAVGVIFWNHGLSGTSPQYQYPPPAIIEEFAKRDWDIVKVQRNPIYEAGWSNGGMRHVEDLIERVKKARATGYKRVIAAGQSYGGAISLEAADRTDEIFGVLAFAPGHGSDACYGGQSPMRLADMLEGSLIPAVAKVKAPRVVVSLAENDECLGGNKPWSRVEQALRQTGSKYIHFDPTMPIRGHGAAGTAQFSTWYRDCLITFMAPDKEPAAGRNTCPTPANTRFLTPATARLQAPTTKVAGAADLTGPWLGTIKVDGFNPANGMEVCLIVDKASTDEVSGNAYFGPGVGQTSNMTTQRIVARKNSETFVHQSAETYRFVITPKYADATLAVSFGNVARTQFTATMKRGCLP